MNKGKFPIFSFFEKKTDPLVYLDSAATTHKPKCVVDEISKFYLEEYATVDRSLYKIGYEASEKVELVRKKVSEFIDCDREEVIFTQSATAGINIVAKSFTEKFLKEGDEILLSVIEHHSNFLPWKEVAKKHGVKIIFFPIEEDGSIDIEKFEKKLSQKTKLVIVSHKSNVLGITNPIKEMAIKARKFGAKIFVDGAQVIGHQKVSVKDMGIDFYVFSAHKMYGPTGVGILYGKKDLLDKMDPCFYGGSMVDRIDGDNILYREAPYKFEYGTPMIGSIIGLGAAIDFLEKENIEKIAAHENNLSIRLYEKLNNRVKFLTKKCKGSNILTFSMDFHPTDVGLMLSLENICIRTGNMCAQPLFNKFGIEGAIRVSIGMYNTFEDIEFFADKLTSLSLVTS